MQGQFVGSPEQLADQAVAWQEAPAADEFTIMGLAPPLRAAGVHRAGRAIPQARRRFRTD